jgi:TatA/E family protein of Tat protein translocase
MHSLLFFEFLGTSELLVILVVALIIFGPRKLPELGRSLGRAVNQFREASDSLKRTWEAEALIANGGAPALAPAAPAGDISAEGMHSELAPVAAAEGATAGGENHAPTTEL